MNPIKYGIAGSGAKFELVTLMLNLVIDYHSNNMKHKVRALKIV